MTRQCRLLSVGVVVAGVAWGLWLAGGELQAQGRGGGAWTTVGGDAQRSSSVRTDPKISVASMQKPGFQFLWKRKLGARPQSLTQPILLPNIIAYKGFKALAFVGGSADNVYAIDYDLNRMFWEQHLATGSKTAATAACPGGLTAITKTTAAAPPAPGGRGRGAGGGGRGQGGPAIAGGRGGGDNVFAISSGGMVHTMNPQIGTDQMPPVKFLPPNTKVVGSILVDNVLYAATTGNCGGAANGVWAVDLLSDAKPVVSWDSQGAAIAGAVAPTFGTDSTIYVATGSSRSPVGNAVVSLEPKNAQRRRTGSPRAPRSRRRRSSSSTTARTSSWRRTRMAACTSSTAHRLAARTTRRRSRGPRSSRAGPPARAGLRPGSMRRARGGWSPRRAGPCTPTRSSRWRTGR